MHFTQPSGTLKKDAIDWRFINFLKKTKIALGIDDKSLAFLLSIDEKNLDKILRREKEIPMEKFQKLLEILNVNFLSVVKNCVDYEMMNLQFHGNKSELPQKYSQGAFGFKRSVHSYFCYLEKYYGQLYKIHILREFQLTPSHFSCLHELINNRFVVDLLNKLEEKGHSREEIILMGSYCYQTNKESRMGRELASLKGTKEVYQRVFEEGEIDKYGKNFHFKLLKMNSEGCRIKVVQNKDAAEALKVKKMGSLNLSLAKLGFFSSLACYVDNPVSSVVLEKCVHLNDSHCEYKIVF